MLEAREAQGTLSGIHVAWVRVARTSEDAGGLPDPELEVPHRDPDDVLKDHVAHAYRELYQRLGVDAQARPPKGEALARRLADGHPLPETVPIGSATALASAVTMVPLHVHDADLVEPPLSVALANEDTLLDPGRKDPIPEGFPVLEDTEGPIAMLGHDDAPRTAPHEDTRRALVIACGPPASVPRILPEALRQVERYADLIGWSFQTTPRTHVIGASE